MPLTQHAPSGRRRALRCWLAASVSLAAPPALAAASCIASSAATVFGGYDTLAASALTITGSVTVSCVQATLPLGTVSYTVSLGPSQTSGTMSRAMAGPSAARLLYNLYTTGSHSTVWGDGSGGTATVGGSVTPAVLGVAATKTHTVHGLVPARQAVRVGAYLDAIVVTVDY